MAVNRMIGSRRAFICVALLITVVLITQRTGLLTPTGHSSGVSDGVISQLLRELNKDKEICADASSSKCVDFNNLLETIKTQVTNSSNPRAIRRAENTITNDVIDSGGSRDPHENVIHILSQAQGKFNLRSDNNKTIFQGGYDAGLIDECLHRNYGDLSGWPRASVIIPFCENELLVDVLHTVHSIVQRSPAELLEEVILIDDNSKKADFKELLENYCSSVFGSKVRIYHSNVTLGLIQGRLLGTRLAKGDVIVTMDAHMEVQETWLQALIWEIKHNRKTMATAMLDWMKPIDGGKWNYEKGINSFMCVFSWDLGFGFAYPRPEIDQKRKHNKTRSFPAPCSVGTIWAMERKFFQEIGELDEQMELWGGENLDLPIRVWLFGGQAVQVPCSHAAHLERPHQRDYRYGWDNSIKRNYKRVIEVWFDEYKENAYMEKPELKDIDAGDLSDRLALKKKAVHDFGWFLANVYPELGLHNNYSLGYEWIRNLGMKKCFHRASELILWECKGEPWKENIWLTVDGYLRTSIQYWTAQSRDKKWKLGPEGSTGTYQQPSLSKWIHWKGGPIMLYEPQAKDKLSKNLCLQGEKTPKESIITVVTCDMDEPKQRWEFKVYTKDYNDLMAKGAVGPYNTDYHQTLFQVKDEWPDEI